MTMNLTATQQRIIRECREAAVSKRRYSPEDFLPLVDAGMVRFEQGSNDRIVSTVRGALALKGAA